MAAPAGYVPLDLVGFTDKGAYVSESTYAANDIVHNDNKMYRSLQDNNTGHALPVSPETETEWWELWLSGGAEDLEAITVKDTSNVTGGGAGKVVVAQTLIDAIAQKVMNDLVAKSMIDNNLLGTDATHVLASPQGKALDEKITQLYSNLATAIYSSDLMAAYDRPTFVRWDENTANTPYKAGLTMNQVGFAFCHGRYSGWQTIVAFSEGSKETFFHYCISGVPSNWLTIFSISENTLADALHTGNNAGIYKVDSSTLNNPSITYGTEIILKDASSLWIFAIIIPTNLSAVYFDFYNGYGDSSGWMGWRKIDLIRAS